MTRAGTVKHWLIADLQSQGTASWSNAATFDLGLIQAPFKDRATLAYKAGNKHRQDEQYPDHVREYRVLESLGQLATPTIVPPIQLRSTGCRRSKLSGAPGDEQDVAADFVTVAFVVEEPPEDRELRAVPVFVVIDEGEGVDASLFSDGLLPIHVIQQIEL